MAFFRVRIMGNWNFTKNYCWWTCLWVGMGQCLKNNVSNLNSQKRPETKNCCLLNTQQAHFGLQAMNVFIKCFCLLSNLWRLFTEEVMGGGIKSGPVVERKTKGEGRERYTMSSKECNLESLDKFDKTVMHFQISCRNEALTWARHGSQRSQAWEHHESD